MHMYLYSDDRGYTSKTYRDNFFDGHLDKPLDNFVHGYLNIKYREREGKSMGRGARERRQGGPGCGEVSLRHVSPHKSADLCAFAAKAF
jgi:hypothetical protein